MSLLVVDASMTLAWCFTDEQTSVSREVLERLNNGDQAIVPHFWSLEILNSLLVGERRGRISAAQSEAFLESPHHAIIETEAASQNECIDNHSFHRKRE